MKTSEVAAAVANGINERLAYFQKLDQSAKSATDAGDADMRPGFVDTVEPSGNRLQAMFTVDGPDRFSYVARETRPDGQLVALEQAVRSGQQNASTRTFTHGGDGQVVEQQSEISPTADTLTIVPHEIKGDEARQDLGTVDHQFQSSWGSSSTAPTTEHAGPAVEAPGSATPGEIPPASSANLPPVDATAPAPGNDPHARLIAPEDVQAIDALVKNLAPERFDELSPVLHDIAAGKATEEKTLWFEQELNHIMQTASAKADAAAPAGTAPNPAGAPPTGTSPADATGTTRPADASATAPPSGQTAPSNAEAPLTENQIDWMRKTIAPVLPGKPSPEYLHELVPLLEKAVRGTATQDEINRAVTMIGEGTRAAQAAAGSPSQPAGQTTGAPGSGTFPTAEMPGGTSGSPSAPNGIGGNSVADLASDPRFSAPPGYAPGANSAAGNYSNAYGNPAYGYGDPGAYRYNGTHPNPGAFPGTASYPPQGYGTPPQPGYGTPPQGYGYPPAGYGYPNSGYGYPPRSTPSHAWDNPFPTVWMPQGNTNPYNQPYNPYASSWLSWSPNSSPWCPPRPSCNGGMQAAGWMMAMSTVMMLSTLAFAPMMWAMPMMCCPMYF